MTKKSDILTKTTDPRVIKLVVELADYCMSRDGDPGALLTALAWTAVNACKSFGVHPRQFVENFESLYSHTKAPNVVPVDPGALQ